MMIEQLRAAGLEVLVDGELPPKPDMTPAQNARRFELKRDLERLKPVAKELKDEIRGLQAQVKERQDSLKKATDEIQAKKRKHNDSLIAKARAQLRGAGVDLPEEELVGNQPAKPDLTPAQRARRSELRLDLERLHPITREIRQDIRGRNEVIAGLQAQVEERKADLQKNKLDIQAVKKRKHNDSLIAKTRAEARAEVLAELRETDIDIPVNTELPAKQDLTPA
ncbi:hypothetical protein FE257_004661 [Aspergillus nanangensis]|uniref:Uncharacterized protein n=1 Tax=Aspergillus nanangensis TaxID=2582783 RepID=A0AAD4H0T0_ASPNN|nr:hypothetical protein FE257_004661 [Aspergillus nanangensis]